MRNFLANKDVFKHPLFWSLVLTVCAAVFASGYHHPDEYMQIIEFANAKLGGRTEGSLPWEYLAQMRPWFQPLTFFLFSKIWLPVFGNPFWVITGYRLTLGLLGILGVYLWSKVLRQEAPAAPKWIQSAPYLMFFIPWLFTRHSSESLSTSLLLIAISLFLLKTGRRWMLGAGICMGLAFLARYQIALFIFGFVIASLHFSKRPWGQMVFAFLGFLISVVLGVGIDAWGYGHWVFTPYNYFFQNVVLSKASQWGVSPFWYYLILMQQNVMPFVSLPMTGAFLMGVFKGYRHPVIFGAFTFVLGHSIVGHKEMRFLFPMLPLLPLFFWMCRDSLLWTFIQRPRIWKALWSLNAVALILVSFWPSRPEYLLQRELWRLQDQIPVLYVRDMHPYILADHAVEYLRPEKLQFATDQPPQRGHWVVSKQGSRVVREENAVCEIRWRIFPEWVEALEFNGWLARTGNWVLARCY